MKETRKHIVLFISALRKGGAERVMVTLAESLKCKGIDVTLVTQYKCEDEYELMDGITRILSEPTLEELGQSRIGNFIKRYQKLRRILREQNPDCVLSFIRKNNFMALLTTIFTQIPVVVSVRADPMGEYYSRFMRFLAKTLYVRAAGVVVQTQKAKKFFPAYIRKKTVILKNPLNKEFDRPRFKGKRDKTIVSVGRVDDNKNHEMIIRAFAQIAAEFPETSLIIYGEGERRRQLQKLAEQLCLSDRISLPGAVTDVAERIYKSGIFVLASDREGMPNALLEAMCMGIPSISTDCPNGGPRELIRDGENGFLIPVRDEEALRDRLRELLRDEERAERMGIEAAKLRENYRQERVTDEWIEYLLSKIGK